MAETHEHIVGYDKPITWTADSGGAAAATIHITKGDLGDGGDLAEVTNTGHNAEQAFVATIKRTNFSATLNFYKAANLTSLGLVFGAKGTISWSFGLGTPASLHVIVEKVNWSNVVNGVLTVNCDFKSDALKADGTVTTSITRAS